MSCLAERKNAAFAERKATMSDADMRRLDFVGRGAAGGKATLRLLVAAAAGLALVAAGLAFVGRTASLHGGAAAAHTLAALFTAHAAGELVRRGGGTTSAVLLAACQVLLATVLLFQVGSA